MERIGILGVGHLAAAVITGLLRGGVAAERLLLSPRGQAQSLASTHGLAIAADNADVVARADAVLLAVRPAAAVDAVSGLPWRAGHVLVSACAGVTIATLAPCVAPAVVMRAMPLTASALGSSPTLAYPDLPAARMLLDPLGPVVPVPSEAAFEAGTVHAAIYGWAQSLIGQGARFSERSGLDPATARRLAALTFVAAGRMAAEGEGPLEDLIASLATPGGITELGLGVLGERGVPEAWESACAAVLARLRPGS